MKITFNLNPQPAKTKKLRKDVINQKIIINYVKL